MYGYGFRYSPNNKMFGGGATPNPLWDGLLAYYTADNTPNDALGTYNGTLVNGATYGTGKINNGFSLDGVNDYVDMGNVLDNNGTSVMSWSFWINGVMTTDNIIYKMASAITGYRIYVSGGNLYFRISQNDTNCVTVRGDTTLINNSVWYHIGVTYNGSKNASGVTITVNGVSQTLTISRNAFTGSSTNTSSLTFSSTTSPYQGIIDEVAIFNRVLTPTEVTELYNSGAGKQYPN